MPNQPAPGRAPAPAIWVGLVLVSLLVMTAVLGRPAAASPSFAAGWLPPDGHRTRLAGPAGVVRASEWAFDTGLAMIATGPAAFGTWLKVTKLEWRTARLARVSTVQLTQGAAPGRSEDLFSIGADGVRAEVVSQSKGGFRAYVPGRLDVPANLTGGRAWTSEGAVLVSEPGAAITAVGYRAQYSAAAPADTALRARGCVIVTRSEQVGDNPPDTTVSTWCRNAGVIAYTDALGRWEPAPSSPAAVAPDVPFDWSTAERLTFAPRRINNAPSVGNTVVAPVSAPGLLPDATVVFANKISADVVALQAAVQPPPVAWRARPGSRNTAAATLGTTTVVADAHRELIAYGPSGEWLWESRLPDLAVVAPVRMGTEVVIATLDGSVTGYDLATGATLWQQRLRVEVRVAPVVAADRAFVVDQTGRLACFDAAGAQRWSADVGRVEHFGVSAGPDPVVIVPNSDGPTVTGYAVADGTVRWHLRQSVTTRDVIALDGVAALRDNDETIGIDPLSGQRLWTWRGERTYAGIGGGNSLLLLGNGNLVLLDGTGLQKGGWPVAIGDSSADDPYLVAANGRVLVYGSRGVELGVPR